MSSLQNDVCIHVILSGTRRYEVKEKKYSYILFKIQSHHFSNHIIQALTKSWKKNTDFFCPTF